MIRLIKNEMYKLFHKKSTLITLFVLFGFVVLVNFFYSSNNAQNFIYTDSNYLEELKQKVDGFDLDNGNMNEYASLCSSLEIQKYVEGKYNDWRVEFYYSKVSSIVEEYYQALYVMKDQSQADMLREKIDQYVKRLEHEDWRFFTEKEILYLKDSLNTREIVTLGDFDTDVLKFKIELLEYRLDNNVSYEKSYLDTAIRTLESTINGKKRYEEAKTEKEKESFASDYARFMENEYILKEKVDINNEQSLYGILRNFLGEYLFLILVFVILIAGSMVSDEFSKGTIKSLLILPYKRNQILLAKLITVLLMIPFVTLFLVVCEFIVGGLFFGYSSLSAPVVAYNFKLNGIEVMSLFKYFLLCFLGLSPMLILLATLAFGLSTIICSTAFAITITFCGFIASSIINQFALFYKVKFLNYFVTTNWDLRYFIFGGSSPYEISMKQSIIVCFIYFAIMVVVMFVVFKRKNIKNI